MKAMLIAMLISMLVSSTTAQSPNIRLVGGFLVKGVGQVNGEWGDTGTSNIASLYDFRLNDSGRPTVCWFRSTITPLDTQGQPLLLGGIVFSSKKTYYYDDSYMDAMARLIDPAIATKGRTSNEGIGIFDTTLVFSQNKIVAHAYYDIVLAGRALKGYIRPHFWWLNNGLFWEQYGTYWQCYCENESPTANYAMSMQKLSSQEAISSNEQWKIRNADGDINAVSIVALPSVDVNGFEKVSTPYYIQFRLTSLPHPDTITKYLVGTDELGLEICTMIKAHKFFESGNCASYQTEYIVPVENKADARLYVDPNGVVYNFAYTTNNFYLSDSCCQECNDMVIWDLLELWLSGGHTRADFNDDGIVNFKEFSFLSQRGS